MQLSDSHPPTGLISGNYTITSIEPADDAEQVRVHLSNYCQELSALAPVSLTNEPASGLGENETCHLVLRFDQNECSATNNTWLIVEAQITPPCLESIPMSQCALAARPALKKMVKMVAAFETDFLQTFVRLSIFSYDQHESLIRQGASRNCHHCDDGGLLIHSVECAEIAYSMAANMNWPTRNREFVAALSLVHDLGKINVMGEPLAPGLHHDDRILERIAFAMKHLDVAWPSGAELARLILCRNRSKNVNCPELIIVKSADQLSACNDASNRAFAGSYKERRFCTVNYGRGRAGSRTFARAVEPRVTRAALQDKGH